MGWPMILEDRCRWNCRFCRWRRRDPKKSRKEMAIVCVKHMTLYELCDVYGQGEEHIIWNHDHSKPKVLSEDLGRQLVNQFIHLTAN